MNYTKILCDDISKTRFSNFDLESIDNAKKCILDFFGVAILGSEQESSKIWEKYYSLDLNFRDAEGGTLFNKNFNNIYYKNSAAVNAAYGHSLDLDDLHSKSITHPGVITIPTAVSLGQKLGSSGKEIITSVILGVEIASRVGESVNPDSYKFWHTTGLVGSLSSAIVASSLFSFDSDKMRTALGTAGSQASGLWQFMDNGSMTKVLHVAKANMNGILSAEITELGLTAAEDILSGDRGLVKAVAKKHDLNLLIENYGKPYKILEVSIKPYPCCRHTHSAITAINNIKEKNKFNIEDIVSIKDYTYGTALDITDNPRPKTNYAHKFSLQYIIAASLIFENITQKAFEEEEINKVKDFNLMEKIEVIVDEKIEDMFKLYPDQWTHRIEIKLSNGDIITEEVSYPLGDSKNPLSWEDLRNKFISSTEDIIGLEKSNIIFEYIRHLEKEENINNLFTKLRGER